MSGNESAERDALGSDYLYSVYLVFRWGTIAYALAVLLFLPYTLPRSGDFNWCVLLTLIAWNAFANGIVPSFFKDKRPHPALLAADVLISAAVFLAGGGQGNVLILYALSSIVFAGVAYGITVAICAAVLFAGFYLASLWMPQHTISRLISDGKGIDRVVCWSLVYPLAAFLSGYLHNTGIKIEEATEVESRSKALVSASLERLALLSDINGQLREVLRDASVELGKIRVSFCDKGEITAGEGQPRLPLKY